MVSIIDRWLDDLARTACLPPTLVGGMGGPPLRGIDLVRAMVAAAVGLHRREPMILGWLTWATVLAELATRRMSLEPLDPPPPDRFVRCVDGDGGLAIRTSTPRGSLLALVEGTGKGDVWEMDVSRGAPLVFRRDEHGITVERHGRTLTRLSVRSQRLVGHGQFRVGPPWLVYTVAAHLLITAGDLRVGPAPCRVGVPEHYLTVAHLAPKWTLVADIPLATSLPVSGGIRDLCDRTLAGRSPRWHWDRLLILWQRLALRHPDAHGRSLLPIDQRHQPGFVPTSVDRDDALLTDFIEAHVARGEIAVPSVDAVLRLLAALRDALDRDLPAGTALFRSDAGRLLLICDPSNHPTCLPGVACLDEGLRAQLVAGAPIRLRVRGRNHDCLVGGGWVIALCRDVGRVERAGSMATFPLIKAALPPDVKRLVVPDRHLAAQLVSLYGVDCDSASIQPWLPPWVLRRLGGDLPAGDGDLLMVEGLNEIFLA